MAGLSYGSLLRDTEVDESENKSLVSVMRISGSRPAYLHFMCFCFPQLSEKLLADTNQTLINAPQFYSDNCKRKLQVHSPVSVTLSEWMDHSGQQSWIMRANLQIKPHGGDVYHLHRLVFKNDCVWKTATKRHLFTFFFFLVLALTLMSI